MLLLSISFSSHCALNSGRLPLFARNTQLQSLLASHNKLGPVLPLLPPSLQVLELSHNLFAGPANFAQLQRLNYLNVAHNRLTGSLDFLYKLPELIIIDVSGNDCAQRRTSFGVLLSISRRDERVHRSIPRAAAQSRVVPSGELLARWYDPGALDDSSETECEIRFDLLCW